MSSCRLSKVHVGCIMRSQPKVQPGWTRSSLNSDANLSNMVLTTYTFVRR